MIPVLKQIVIQRKNVSVVIEHEHSPNGDKPLQWVRRRVHLTNKTPEEIQEVLWEMLEENDYDSPSSNRYCDIFMKEVKKRCGVYVPQIASEYLLTGGFTLPSAIAEMRRLAKNDYRGLSTVYSSRLRWVSINAKLKGDLL